jgi:Calcineurin-like phosphoesterase
LVPPFFFDPIDFWSRPMTQRPKFYVAITAVVLALTSGVLLGRTGNESAVQADMQAYMAARTAAYGTLTSFSFGVYSDIHMSEDAIAVLTRAQWQGLLTNWRDTGNLLGVIVGDLGYGNLADRDNVLSGPAAVPGAPPVFYSMGNHENDAFGKRSWIDSIYPGAVQPSSWTNQPSLAPGNADHVYWSFNVGPSTHFIMLDGDYVTWDGITGRLWQTFGQAQLTWLANDIHANSDKNILVFVHEPVDQQTTGSTPDLTLNDKGGLLDLLTQHPKQAFVFSGHFHGLSGITKWKGITCVHVQTGSFPTYGVRVTVNGDVISVPIR